MEECRYCGAEFEEEAAYLDHLEADHAAELGPIDRRRLDRQSGGSRIPDDLDLGPLAPVTQAIWRHRGGLLLAAFVLALGGIFWTLAGGGTDGRIHEHGTMVVTINDEPVDLDQPAYHQSERFHFHPGDGEVWHMHPERVTFKEAMAELGMPVTASSVTINGTTYEDADPETSVTMLINGDPANLDHALRDEDHVEIRVTVDVAG